MGGGYLAAKKSDWKDRASNTSTGTREGTDDKAWTRSWQGLMTNASNVSVLLLLKGWLGAGPEEQTYRSGQTGCCWDVCFGRQTDRT